jgi:2-phosphosulfolactate phosphatase
MRSEVILLPADLRPEHLDACSVVVFDVLRATTSMTAALAAGAREIRIFGDTSAALAGRDSYAKNTSGSLSLLCGEESALAPPGFDLGNSPPAFTQSVCAGRALFISTTNGTRAVLAARGAQAIFIAALVNASAAARVVAETRLNVTLLCAGTNGQIALEDLLGCGAVLEALSRIRPVIDESDRVLMARRLFASARHDLPGLLRQTQGGQNIMNVGLAADIDFAARLDVFDVVGRVVGQPPVVVNAGLKA